MRRFSSHHPLNVFRLELDVWPYPDHTHNFYELILIEKGKGTHYINQVSCDYQARDIFLLTPEDHHQFEIQDKTTFVYVKFTEQLFEEHPFKDTNSWQQRITQILYQVNILPGCIIKNKTDKAHTQHLILMLLDEFQTAPFMTRELVILLFEAILVLLVRNIEIPVATSSQIKVEERTRISNLLAYIRQNMGERNKLTQIHLSEQFNMSPNYVSLYLKKHLGLGLQSLITETRLKTAERLLEQSQLTINQIADRVGFSDASHMNKMFKRYRSLNPSTFRK